MTHPLDGRWDLVITSPMGEQKSFWDLKVEGDTITGSLNDAATEKMTGVVESTESVDDKSFAFKTTLKLQFGKLPFTMTGTIDSETEISGKAAMPIVTSKFRGTKRG